jgi:His-Xaa-Ser system protein HxsD
MSGIDSPRLFVFSDGQIQTSVDLRAYRLTAVQKTAYRLAERCTVALGSIHDDTLPLTFIFSQRVSEAAADETARIFFQELLDQELREKVGDETRAIRSLLLAHAFSKTDLIRPDDE